MKYSEQELLIINESCALDNTYEDISYFILEDTGISRSPNAVALKANSLGWKKKAYTVYTTKTFIQKIKEISKDIKILGEFKGSKAHIKCKCKCKIDNSIWYPRPDSLLSGSKCPVCNINSLTGYYQSLSNTDANNLDFPLYLYNIKLQLEDEIFCKYGLTKNYNRKRYTSYYPYKVVEEISFVEYDAWTAICKEKSLTSNYTPKHKFKGWTECYKG